MPKLRDIEIHPQLAELLTDDWNPEKITLGQRMDDDPEAHYKGLPDKGNIHFVGEKQNQLGVWEVQSLRTLFRGNTPALTQLKEYPPEYVPFFHRVESNIVTACQFYREPTDEQFMEIFSTMRRRPDGRSLGMLHDIIWQAACLELGMRPYSKAEYEAVFRRLERSARTWRQGPSSRNYIAFIRQQRP